jgi:hypothetical protein
MDWPRNSPVKADNALQDTIANNCPGSDMTVIPWEVWVKTFPKESFHNSSEF